MPRPDGYLVADGPTGRDEFDTFNCAHCQRILVGIAQVGGFCRLCDKNLCQGKACHNGCKPFEAKIEAMEARDRLRKAVLG